MMTFRLAVALSLCVLLCGPSAWAADKPAEKPAEAKKAENKKADQKKADDKKTEDKKADDKKAEAKKDDKKADDKKTVAKKPEKKKATVVRFTIKGEYPEGPTQPGLFGEMQPSLSRLLHRFDDAAEDKSVAAVWLRIEGVELGRGKTNELRGAVARLRKAGKHVYAELAGADTSEYLLAAACEEIVMPSSGMLLLPGVRAEMTFYKGLLEKLGLEFDALQMGKYKGAAEPMTRTSMSGPLHESIEALVDDNYEALVATIAKDRGLKDYEVKTLLDRGMFSATAAKKAGLIDEVQYADQFQDTLRKKLKVDEINLVTDYKKKQLDADFTGIGGLMKLMELFGGSKPAEKVSSKPKIAVVYAVGVIMEGKSRSDMWGENTLGSTTLCEAIEKAQNDPKVSAVVLRIDSPGGSAIASDLIWRETVRGRKPLVASMGNVAGSGGYYIAMGARKIFAEPGTLTGSIGVIGGKLVTRGLYSKLGMTTEVIARGKNSGALSSRQPFTADERKAWTELLGETYHQFVSKAAQGRKMKFERLDELAQGRVYTGRMAQKLGLVDELGTLADAITEAKRAAGLKADAEVELLILPRPKTVFEQLFGGEAGATTDFDSLVPDVMRTLRQAAVWQQLLQERVLLWMPYSVQVK